jgi:hypothetical protein
MVFLACHISFIDLDWVNEDLLQNFQSNRILSEGFQNPKCLAALELMKSDPRAAKARFSQDSDVTIFLSEFGKVMSNHFNAEAEKRDPAFSSTVQTKTVFHPRISENEQNNSSIKEIGVLHAAALKNKKSIDRSAVDTR